MIHSLPIFPFHSQEGAALTNASTQATNDNAEGATKEGPGLPGWFPFVLIGGLFYLILIRPQAKEQRRRKAVLDGLKKGDEVMTNAGIFGKVVNAEGDVITLQVADGVRMRFSRAAVSGVVDGQDED